MSKKACFFYICSVMSLTMSAYAENNDPKEVGLMTARDVLEKSVSNINIKNGTNQTITASGLYIVSLEQDDCSACSGGIVGGDNVGGAFASFVTFGANQTLAIGQNYLYNMLYNEMYYARTTISAPCLLPGCSWPGDSPNEGWCITINAASLDSDYTFSNYQNGSNPPSNIPAYGEAGNSNPFDYQYDLIDPSTLGGGNACLGPITCNDKTLNCKVANAQTETFAPY